MRLRVRIGTVLVLISFTLAVVFAFVPANFKSSTITWRPDSAADSGALQLTRGAPERMSIETTCEMARAQNPTDPPMLSTGSLELTVVDDLVRVQTAPFGPSVEAALPPGDCLVRATYTRDPSEVQLSIGDVRKEVEVAPLVIRGLYTTDPPAISSVDIITQETGLAPSWGRWIIGFLALAALVAGATLMWLPITRPRQERRGWRALTPRLSPVDGVVSACVLVLALITPPLVDDGWIIGRTRELQERWWFGDLFAAQDAWLPHGVIHELVLSVLQSVGLDLAQLRILVALVVALTWVVLRRGVLVPVVGEAASRWPAAAATYVAFAGAWLITVRQEPMVLFLAVLALSVAISEERSKRPGWVFVGLLSAGLALATHQTGWVAGAPALMILWTIQSEIRRDRTRWRGLTMATVAAVSGFAIAVFAAADVNTVLEGARTFGDGPHSAGPLDELARYRSLLSDSGARVSTLFILLVWCLLGSLGINTVAPQSKRLWILCMLWLGGLLLTSSKWEWHFAVYAVPAACLATLAGVELNRRDRPAVVGSSAALIMICLAAGIGMSSSGTWNVRDLSSNTWPELEALLLGDEGRIFWYVALLSLLALGMLADGRRGRWRPAALAAMCLAIVFPIGASMAWLVADAREPGWSPTGANLRQLTDGDACGVLDGLEIDADVTPLETGPRQGDQSRLAPNAFPHIERISSGPLGGEVPTWGTWAAQGQTSPDARTGLFQSPSFQVGDADEITIWSSFGSADLLWAKVVFTSASGTDTGIQVTPDAEAHWARLRLTVPEDAVEVRVDVDDRNTGFGGWLAVSSPVTSSGGAIDETLSNSPGYADPLDATSVPCMNLPELAHGYWGKVDYLASEGWAFDTSTLRGLTVTDVACRPDVMCLSKIDYPMANVQATSSRP